ncbi:hypothetical protein FACS1894189_9120 [Planctomycetales bacterium]|nr:hypothetical protein FACS1894189_9120 [Planctomycetales bacterium]
MPEDKIDPAALSPQMLAKLLSSAAKRRITEEQVQKIAEAGNLLSLDGTINLVRYTAFLVGEKYRNDN